MRGLNIAFAGSLFLLSACGGSPPPPDSRLPYWYESGASKQSPETPGSPPSKPFHELTQNEKLDVMKKVVVPTMKPLFQAQNAEKFKDFGCTTCHGPNAKSGKFDMPNPDLPKLNFADNLKVHKEKTPEMLTFMMDKVNPEMAKALNEPPFDPATGKGFGCKACHLSE